VIREKLNTWYFDEIYTQGQFHQPSMSSFYMRRFWKHKKTVKLSVFFAFLESARAKAAHRTLMKLTPRQHATTGLEASLNISSFIDASSCEPFTVSVCEYVWVCVCVCEYVWVCVYVSACVYVWVCECVNDQKKEASKEV